MKQLFYRYPRSWFVTGLAILGTCVLTIKFSSYTCRQQFFLAPIPHHIQHHPAPDTIKHSVVVGSKNLKILLALAFSTCARTRVRHLFPSDTYPAPIQHQFFSGTYPAPYLVPSGTRHYPALSSGGEQKTSCSCSRSHSALALASSTFLHLALIQHQFFLAPIQHHIWYQTLSSTQ